MNAFLAHFGFEFRTGIRNKNLLLMNYLFPLTYYAIAGLIMTQINPFFLDDTIPAMVTFAVLASTLLGMPDPLVSARESGIFRSYKINGVPLSSILAIPSITTALHLTVVMAIISLTAPLFFTAPTPANWVYFLLVFLALAFACIGLSVLIGVISPSTRLTVLFSQLLFIPSMLVGGMMFPLSMLPDEIATAARLLPATHAMNAFRGLAMGTGADFSAWGSLLVLAASGLLSLGMAAFLFTWDRRNAERRAHPLLALVVLLPYVAAMFLM